MAADPYQHSLANKSFSSKYGDTPGYSDELSYLSRSRDPKLFEDILGQSGVALTTTKTYDGIYVDGYNKFIYQVEGNIGSDTLTIQAQLRIGGPWVTLGVLNTAGTTEFHGWWRRLRVNYVRSNGTFTYVNLFAVREDGATNASSAGGAGTFSLDQSVPGISNAVVSKVVASTAVVHRSGITSADVLAVPGTVTCTLLTGVGSASAGTYTVFVVAGNLYGRTTATPGNTTVATTGSNLGIRAAFAQVTGATFYDIYCSTDGAAAKFVGRVTEAQRASGIILTAVNTTGAGGTAGAVDIYVAGTGLAVNGGQLAQNYAYTPESITAINPLGFPNVDIDVLFSRTGDIVAPSLVLLPFYEDTSGTYASGEPITMLFGGATNAYYPNRQIFRCSTQGRKMVVAVASIAGTGASVTINTVTN